MIKGSTSLSRGVKYMSFISSLVMNKSIVLTEEKNGSYSLLENKHT